MGKRRQFDEEVVLEKLATHFWKHGYSATKVDELSEVTGLTKTSLYNAFGNKEALFVNSLNFYVENSLRVLMESIDTNLSLSKNIEYLLEKSFKKCDRQVLGQGCLLTNSIVELNGNDPLLHDTVTKLYDKVKELKHSFFAHYVNSGRVTKGYTTGELTDFYMTFWQGLRVQSQNNGSEEILNNSIKPFLKFIKSIEIS